MGIAESLPTLLHTELLRNRMWARCIKSLSAPYYNGAEVHLTSGRESRPERVFPKSTVLLENLWQNVRSLPSGARSSTFGLYNRWAHTDLLPETTLP
jgi:hypothetical protein